MSDREPGGIHSAIQGVAELEQLCHSVDLDDFGRRLVDAGVMSLAELGDFQAELSGVAPQLDTEVVADALVRTDRISPYQLVAILSGRADRLTLGEYTVIRPLGAGGMGEVLLAVHRRMKRQVAIKLLPQHFVGDQEMIRRFEREVEVAAQLTHPNIVTAYDAGQARGTHFLVMEYVNGCDLARLVRDRGPLSRDAGIRCVLQAGEGLSYAHEKGVIHRDIKPGNLLASRDGCIKVLDMGLARWSSASADSAASELSVTGAVMGTVDYMAPEQAVSSKSADERSDIYSLGCALYALLHGEPVFPRDTVVERIMAHQAAPTPALVDGTEEADEKLNAVFQRCLSKDPEARYQTAHDFCEDLRACLADAPNDLNVQLDIPEPDTDIRRALEDTVNQLPERSLISTLNLSPEGKSAASEASRRPSSRNRWVALVALLLALGGAGFLGVPLVLRLLTPDGALVVKCFVEGAIVEVDGVRKLRITDPESKSNYRLELPAGEHEVRVFLEDGTVIKSDRVTIASRNATLFEAAWEPASPDKLGKTNEPGAAASRVLTVAQDGSAQYQTIGDAVVAAQPGDTVRVLDEGVYRETVQLASADRFKNLTIESPGGATLMAAAGGRHSLVLFNVQGVTVRGFKIEAGPDAAFGCVAGGMINGSRIMDCVFSLANGSRASANLSLEGLSFEPGQEPFTVANCSFTSGPMGLRLSGLQNDNSGLPCGGLVFRDNHFVDVAQPIVAAGSIHDVWIVGNTIQRANISGVQFMWLMDDPRNLVVANNSIDQSVSPFRLWEKQFMPAQAKVVANVSVRTQLADWETIVGSSLEVIDAPGDAAAYLREWTFANNFREGVPPPKDAPRYRGWFPPSPTCTLQEKIELLSLDSQSEDYLRPAVDSPIASGGMGGEFPAYAGAVPPEGAEPFDWEQAFARAVVFSRLPEDVITVAKTDVAHHRSLNDALKVVQPGMTIRVTDDSVYEESLLIDQPERFANITLEATAGATISAGDRLRELITIRRVPGVRIGGFRIEMGAKTSVAVLVNERCPGMRLESLTVDGSKSTIPGNFGVTLEWIDSEIHDEPIIVRHCKIDGADTGLMISGMQNDYETASMSRNIQLLDNLVTDANTGILVWGDVRNILVAGNLIDGCQTVGLQLEQLTESSSNILFANNTIKGCRFGVRLWSHEQQGKSVKVINNLSFECGGFDWSYFENGGSRTTPKGPGDFEALNKAWVRQANFREAVPPPATIPFAAAWMPPSPEDTLAESLTLLSRDPTDADFARPPADSPLATAGAGGDFPSYVGAVPPDPERPFDWTPVIESMFPPTTMTPEQDK